MLMGGGILGEVALMENTLEINFVPKQSRAKENTEATANVSPGTNTAYDCERDGHDWREGTAVGFFRCVRCGRNMSGSERFEFFYCGQQVSKSEFERRQAQGECSMMTGITIIKANPEDMELCEGAMAELSRVTGNTVFLFPFNTVEYFGDMAVEELRRMMLEIGTALSN